MEMSVYFISREEYLEHLRTGIPYKNNVAPYFKIGKKKEFDMYSSIYTIFHNSGNDYFKALHKNDERSVSPFNDYFENGTEFYFTSNGVSFYKVLDAHIGEGQLIEMSAKLITDNTYMEFNHAFMIMPFRKATLNSFYHEHIKNYLSTEMHVDLYRADDFNDNDIISDTIYKEIERSEFIICEISECNKNVFFEIGYAKALKKELIFILQAGHDHDFFDVGHIRRIEYQLEHPEELQIKLKNTIESIRRRH